MWSEPQRPGSSWFLFYRLSVNLNASINPRWHSYAKWIFVGSNLLISARLQLICGLSSGELLPLCHWNFSLHFTPVRFITFLYASSSASSANTHINTHIQKKTQPAIRRGGRTRTTMLQPPIAAKMSLHRHMLVHSAKTVPWISCSPEPPLPHPELLFHACVHAPSLIKDCASPVALTFYHL